MDANYAETLQQAVAAHRNGNLKQAERLYKIVISAPLSLTDTDRDREVVALAYNNLGFARQHSGDLDAAIENYRQAINVKPDNHEAHNNLGYTLALKGDLKGAIASYREAIRIKPDFIEAYYHMGQALQERGDLRASIESYNQLLRFKPDSADAFNARGAVLQLKGELDAAIESYHQVLNLDSNYYEAYNNMGSAWQAKGELDRAIECFDQALKIKPEYASALNNKGHALFDKGETDAAIECYREAIQKNPDSVESYNNLANALRETGNYEEALKIFEIIDEPRFKKAFEVSPSKPLYWINAKSQLLECLYILGRYEQLEERIKQLAESGDKNRRVSAVAAFVADQLKIDNPHTFCKNPLDFVHVGNLGNYVTDVDTFIENLIEEGDRESQVWEPIHGVTKSGFATSNTMFHAGANCTTLEEILRHEIAFYRNSFESEDCEFIRQWPAEYDLKGWFVRLVKNGHQRSHIHPAGWLSGVVYLKTLDLPDSDEGAIELGLHGFELPILDDSYKRKVHRPKAGEILLFPSSLFHRTIPFSQDTDRCVIAFDLHPAVRH
jgi:tetratricopeptide (TPR) repeat protein